MATDAPTDARASAATGANGPAAEPGPGPGPGEEPIRSGWARGAVRRALPTPVRMARRALVSTFTSTRTRRAYPIAASRHAFGGYAAAVERLGAFHYTENRRFHEALLRHTDLAGTEDDVARRAVTEFFISSEMFWRPWLMEHGRVVGMEHYRAALDAGRGIITVFPHFGNPYGQFPVMRRYGIDAWVIASPHHFLDLGNGYDGRFARQGKAYVDMLGPDRAIVRAGPDVPTAEGGFAATLRHLHERHTVSITFDSVGSMPTPFMGRELSLASGPSKLSCASGALMLPFVNRTIDYRPVVEFAPPLDPEDYDGAQSLQAAVAAVMERWARQRPESVWPLESQPGGPPLIKGPPLAGPEAG